MGSDIETIKERLGIAEVVGGHVKLEKSGASFKGRCPFHNEKTPSFFVSPLRQSYYCFGCGAKGDIFTFVEETEGLSFKEALKELALRAGVELKGAAVSRQAKTERDKLRAALEAAAEFFEKKLVENEPAQKYLLSRGLSKQTIKEWRIGYAPAEWRSLYHHLVPMGFSKEVLVKAGLVKPVTGAAKEPYDVFRDRLVFPLADQNGEIVAFSGRALAKETEPKYLNTPETMLFAKSELLYGLGKAKAEVRKKNYAVLVEGQMDLVLSHQAGVPNTVASSGTAFTAAHLERLKRLSPRIILAFDGDRAGEAAAEKASALALSLGLEVKVARLPEGADPADMVAKNPEDWKEILRHAKPAVEHFLDLILEREKDRRKALKAVEEKLLPILSFVGSSIERSHFASLIATKTGVKEEMIWEDLRKVKAGKSLPEKPLSPELETKRRSRSEEYGEVVELLKENPHDPDLLRHHAELSSHMKIDQLDEEIAALQFEVENGGEEVLSKISTLVRQRDEERRKVL
ncbi:DNA primase [Candidatus Parcubacteria bacterium]|nr:DNA primase [Candidatus Parcubacteria bacterium]